MCTLRNSCDTISLPSSSSDEAGEVEIVDWCSAGTNKKGENRNFDSVDPSLKKFIQICLSVEQSEGMLRVINRSLLLSYQGANQDYKDSAEFKEILNRTGRMIMKQPRYKFSFIKSLCENLKQNKKKKRIGFVTIDTAVKRNGRKHVHNRMDTKTHASLSDGDEVVLLDETITIDDDEKENDSNGTITSVSEFRPQVMSLRDSESRFQEIVELDKENGVDKDEHNEMLSNFSHNATLPKGSTISSEQQIVSQENLLTVQRIEQHIDLKAKIKSIEDEIAKLKERIDILDQTEVDQDTGRSPYVLCHIYKAQVVNLYSYLCHITESPSVKKHEVRLSVMEGHSEAPVKILEKFLNNNIQNNGYPSFPDFSDVNMCVVMANDIHKLGWDATKVMKESRTLFIQCGRALQKLRQEREWKDLLANVKQEDHDDDPADHDPELMAKLEANKARALKTEMDIIDEYAAINTKSAAKQSKRFNTHFPTNNNHSDTSDSDANSVILCEEDMAKNEDFFKKLREIVKIEKTDAEFERNVIQKNEIDNNDGKTESMSKRLEELGDDFTVTIEVDDPFLVVEISSDSD